MTPVGEKIYDALRDPRVKIILLPGGTRSSKTHSIMQNLHVSMSENRNFRIMAWRAKQTWVRMSILSDWEREFLAKNDLTKYYSTTKIPPFFRMKQTRSSLEFGGLDDPQKVHGVAADLHWINEAMEMERDTFRQILQRSKGPGKSSVR
jgi:Phage terminase large subunit